MRVELSINGNRKYEFEEICRENGLSMKTAITMLAKVMVDEYKLPFDVVTSKEKMYNHKKKETAKYYEKQIEIALGNVPVEEREFYRKKIINDICDIRETTRFTEFEYFRLKLYLMEREDWLKEYLCDRDTPFIYTQLNDECTHVMDKYEVYNKFKEYFKREAVPVRNKSEISHLGRFLAKHKKIVVKPIDGSLGRGVRTLTVDEWKQNSHEFEKNLFDDYPNGVLLEEVIDQHESVAQFNPASANTLRVMTVKVSDDDIRTFTALRIGTTDDIVDNVSRKGLTCRIDTVTGEISDPRNGSGEVFDQNPNTGVQITGVKIPYIQEAIEFAKEISMKMTDHRYCGWDIALSKDGWVIVEFNGKSGVVCLESALGYGFRQEFEEIFETLGKPAVFKRPCDEQ